MKLGSVAFFNNLDALTVYVCCECVSCNEFQTDLCIIRESIYTYYYLQEDWERKKKTFARFTKRFRCSLLCRYSKHVCVYVRRYLSVGSNSTLVRTLILLLPAASFESCWLNPATTTSTTWFSGQWKASFCFFFFHPKYLLFFFFLSVCFGNK